MTPPLFLTDPGALERHSVVLSGPEGHHAATVRRIGVGESVQLADGAGTRASCTVTEVRRDTVVCAVHDRDVEPAPQPRVTVVQALPKGDRGELAVEVMTEAGVERIVPWAAERCVARWKPDREAKALRKWRTAAREAAKQARHSRVPEVRDSARTSDVVSLLRAATLGIVLHGEAHERLSALTLPDSGDIIVVVGPEGGITPAELAAFSEVGAVPAALGPGVLRASTAGIAALSVLHTRSGRW